MSLPKIVDRQEWVAARTALLEREKQFTRARDALNADRRRLPMVAIEADYRFDGPDGEVGLADLFEGRRQLIVGHMMFDPAWENPCSSCSAGADEVSAGLLEHLAVRDTTYAAVSRAPLEKIAKGRAERGWPFAWYSSFGSSFNHDFGVTAVPGEENSYNYRSEAQWAQRGLKLAEDSPGEWPGTSVFLRLDDGRIFHTYSMYGRGAETLGGSYYWLDITALGRQEDWEEPKGRSADVRAAEPNFAR